MLARGPLVDTDLIRVLLPPASAEPAPAAGLESLALEPAVEEVERKLILRSLGASHDNKAEAARLLGVSERTLWYKLKRYGL